MDGRVSCSRTPRAGQLVARVLKAHNLSRNKPLKNEFLIWQFVHFTLDKRYYYICCEPLGVSRLGM